MPDVVDVDVADDTGFVDDKDGPLGVAFVRQDPVLLGNRAVRPKIAEERVVDAAQAVSPGFEAGNVIDADAQDLGI